MHRFRWRIPLRSTADLNCKSKPPDYKWKYVAAKLDSSQTITTSGGYYCCEDREESMIRSLQMKIVNALSLGERKKASSLLSDLGRGNYPLKADDFDYILNYCARSPDPLFVMETWRMMMEKEIDVNYRCYLLSIRALCKGGYLEEAFNLLNLLRENHDSYPLLHMYNNILSSCAQTRSIGHANHCLDLMEDQVLGKNEITYSALLKLAVWQQNLSAVHGIWKEYIKYYSLSIISLRKFIWSFTRLRDLKSAYATLQHMVALALKGSIFVNTMDDRKLYSSRLDIPIPSSSELCLRWEMEENENLMPSLTDNCNKMGMQVTDTEQCIILGKGSKAVKSVGKEMLEKHKSIPIVKVLLSSFNDVMHTCAQTHNYTVAEQLMSQMQNLGLEPSSRTYDGFIRALVSERGFIDGMEVLKSMQERKLKPYNSTFATLSVGCSKVLELDLAEALLDEIFECQHAYPFNVFLAACDKLDKPERAVPMLAKMKQLGLRPDSRTYELLFSLFGNVNAPYEDGNVLSRLDAAKRINAIEMDMMENGIQHTHLSMKNLLKALGAEGMISELMQYLQVAEDQLCRINPYLATLTYNTVLHSLVEARESHMATEIFRKMKSCGFLPDAATYTIMIDCCSITRCYRSACALVSMMVRDGFCPQNVTYTALIKILLKYEDFNEALNLLDQASSEGIVPDVLLYNTILQEACLKGRIDVIEFIVERMHREKIQPDPSTCSYVFSAYVDLGFLTTGMEALQVLSMRMISQEDCALQEKKMEYEEDFILAEDSEADLRILQFFKNSEENLAFALLNLRWCATVGSSISWFPNQSTWASRLMSNYDTSRSKVALQ